MNAASRLRVLRVAQGISGRLPPRWDRRARELGKVAVNYRGARSTALRAFSFDRVRRHAELVVVPFGHGRLLVDTRDQEIGRTVFITGGYERLYMDVAVRRLAASGLSPAGKTFVDVGANIGTSTVDALLEFGFGRAICFEPGQENFRLLQMNLSLNDLDSRATAHRAALSDFDGTAQLQLSSSNSGDHRIAAGDAPGGGPSEQIECRRFDSLVEAGEIDLGSVGLVWVDAQGHEASVLAGAAAAMAAGVPLVLEYWPAVLGTSLPRLQRHVQAFYTSVVDIRLLAHGIEDGAVLAASDLGELDARYPGPQLTDVLLLP